MAETCIGALLSTVASSHLATVGDCDATASASGAVVRARKKYLQIKLTGTKVTRKLKDTKLTKRNTYYERMKVSIDYEGTEGKIYRGDL